MKFTPKLIIAAALLALYIWLLVLHVPFYPAYTWLTSASGSWGRIQVSLSLLVFVFVLALGLSYLLRILLKKKWSWGAMSFWSAIVGVMILNLGMASLPFVIGWDATTHYFITIREIAENGNFRTGVYPYLVELVVGLIASVIGLKFAPMLMVLMGASVLLWGLIRWTSLLKLSPALQRITVLALFVIPTIQFQLTKDIKLDIILSGLILLALSFWYEKKHVSAAVAFGLAPLVKLTAFWFWPGFALYLLYLTWSLRGRKKKFPAQLKKTLASLLILVVPVLAWGTWNIVRAENNLTKKNIVEVFLKSSGRGARIVPLNKPVKPLESNLNTEKTLSLNVEKTLINQVFAETIELPKPEKTEVTEYTTPPRAKPGITARQEELERYGGWSLNPFSRIYNTMTSKNILLVMRHHTNMGFVWPWIVAGGILAFFFARKKKQPLEIYWIYATLMVIFVLWIYQGEAVPWYGLPMLLGLLPIGLLWMSKYIFTSKQLAWLMSLPLAMGVIAWMYHYEPDYTLLSNRYWKNPTPENLIEVQQRFYRQEMMIGDIVNASEHKNEKIWKVGSMVNAFVDRYDKRVLVDSLVDRWAQFSYNKTDEQILALLEHNNIKWFVIDRYVPNIEMDPNGTLHQKYNGMMRFLDEYGELHHDVRRLRLYRVDTEKNK